MSEIWKRFKRAMKERRIPWMRVLVIMVGLLWLHSALEKLFDPAYVDGFAGTMFFFGIENPNAWYVDFLNGFVIPNAAAFAMAIAIGELLVGLSFVLGGFTRFGAIGGILLNVNFFFAASHVSPAVWSVNLLLIGLQLVFIFSKEAKELSVDQLVQSKLSKRLGSPGRKALDIVIGAPAGAT
ncbi:MAG: DoxX family protein [Methanomassiliicoccales archaeon]|nr:MAG: DoxX family protein [Methanomassiliicoccales archaeon]